MVRECAFFHMSVFHKTFQERVRHPSIRESLFIPLCVLTKLTLPSKSVRLAPQISVLQIYRPYRGKCLLNWGILFVLTQDFGVFN